jgi:hypothetical protein
MAAKAVNPGPHRPPAHPPERRRPHAARCAALPLTRRCLRLDRELRQALHALRFALDYCQRCAWPGGEGEPAQPGVPSRLPGSRRSRPGVRSTAPPQPEFCPGLARSLSRLEAALDETLDLLQEFPGVRPDPVDEP